MGWPTWDDFNFSINRFIVININRNKGQNFCKHILRTYILQASSASFSALPAATWQIIKILKHSSKSIGMSVSPTSYSDADQGLLRQVTGPHILLCAAVTNFGACEASSSLTKANDLLKSQRGHIVFHSRGRSDWLSKSHSMSCIRASERASATNCARHSTSATKDLIHPETEHSDSAQASKFVRQFRWMCTVCLRFGAGSLNLLTTPLTTRQRRLPGSGEPGTGATITIRPPPALTRLRCRTCRYTKGCRW